MGGVSATPILFRRHQAQVKLQREVMNRVQAGGSARQTLLTVFGMVIFF
jgi:hypothetical protein